MTADMTASVTFDEGMAFTATADSGHEVQLDAAPPTGRNSGFRPMELVLVSLASCSGMDVLSILQKMRQPVRSLKVRARGRRQDEQPKAFTAIDLVFQVTGDDVDPNAVAKAIALTEEHYCPVWAMLKPSVAITASFELTHDEASSQPTD
ncbi:MAG TPA: OsmC family protein [Roseiflexaceae bacterium]|nr:OsmC family protein [Roseiflexaceae bacterium]